MFGCFGGGRAGGRLGPSTLSSTLGRSTSSNSAAGALHTASHQQEVAHPASEALRSGRLAVTFSGGGFLLPYFIGVSEVLLSLGVLRPSGAAPTPVAGASAGSLVAASLACGLTPAQMYDSFLDSVRDCRTNGSYRRLDEVLMRQLEASLPPDAAERCSGVATVVVTSVFPTPRTRRISAFDSRADLIAALMASCHIPGYFNGDITTSYRGKVTVDGGVTALMPVPTAHHDFLLKVCCFPREHVARLPIFNRRRALRQLSLGISPGAFGPWPYSLRDMLAAALHPRSDDFLQLLLEEGRRDATQWAAGLGVCVASLKPTAGPQPQPQPLLQAPALLQTFEPAAAAAAAEEESVEASEAMATRLVAGTRAGAGAGGEPAAVSAAAAGVQGAGKARMEEAGSAAGTAPESPRVPPPCPGPSSSSSCVPALPSPLSSPSPEETPADGVQCDGGKGAPAAGVHSGPTRPPEAVAA